jgi:hypothetical protein
MKRFFALLAALAAFALFARSLIDPSGLSAAPNESIGFGVFDGPDTVDPSLDRLRSLAAAARNVGPSRGECPRGTITAFAEKGDPLFQRAVAEVRRDAVRNALARMGVDISQFYFDYKVHDRETLRSDTVLKFGAPRDETPPTVEIASTPEPGSKVAERERITLTVTARDDSTRWESGIRGIRLFADSDDGRLVDEGAYPPHLPTCEGQPPAQTLRAVYTVPSPAPPIVRLRAISRDHAGHNAEKAAIAEFPTGDWYGTLTWTHFVIHPRAQTTTRASADVSLKYDGSGGLTGRLVGSHSATSSMGPCSGITMTHGRIQANLIGSYTPGRDAMTIRAEDEQTSPMQMEISCPGAPPVVSRHPEYYEFYERALRGLRPTADGGFQSSDEQERPCEAGSTCTTRISLTVRRARN